MVGTANINIDVGQVCDLVITAPGILRDPKAKTVTQGKKPKVFMHKQPHTLLEQSFTHKSKEQEMLYDRSEILVSFNF